MEQAIFEPGRGVARAAVVLLVDDALPPALGIEGKFKTTASPVRVLARPVSQRQRPAMKPGSRAPSGMTSWFFGAAGAVAPPAGSFRHRAACSSALRRSPAISAARCSSSFWRAGGAARKSGPGRYSNAVPPGAGSPAKLVKSRKHRAQASSRGRSHQRQPGAPRFSAAGGGGAGAAAVSCGAATGTARRLRLAASTPGVPGPKPQQVKTGWSPTTYRALSSG